MIANLIFFEIFFSLLSWWQYIFICLAVGLRVLDVVAASIWSYVVLWYAPFSAPDFCQNAKNGGFLGFLWRFYGWKYAKSARFPRFCAIFGVFFVKNLEFMAYYI